MVARTGGGNLNKSDWDICDSRTDHMEIDFNSLKMSEKSVVSGLDLAHLQQSKGKEQKEIIGLWLTSLCRAGEEHVLHDGRQEDGPAPQPTGR